MLDRTLNTCKVHLVALFADTHTDKHCSGATQLLNSEEDLVLKKRY